MERRRIGVFGGTFDPVHFGHLRPAMDVAESLNLDHVRLIPSATPPHRASPQASAEQRVTMLQLAVKNSNCFVIDDRELYREGPSYTVDTLISLREQYPDDALYLILGMDAFLGIQSWHQWQKLLELSHLVVMQRPSESFNMTTEIKRWYEAHVTTGEDNAAKAGVIFPVMVTQLAISASVIREKLAKKADPIFLLPEATLSFIKTSKLYEKNDG